MQCAWPRARPEADGGGQDWRTAAGSTGAEVPRLQIGSAGTWAPSALKRRARLFSEPAVSGVLAQSQCDYFSHIATVSLQRGCSPHGESWRAHLRITFRAPAEANWFETSVSEEKKRVKQVTYPCLLGVQLETWGAPGVQSRVLDTSSETSGCLQRGARSAPPSNKPLATWALPASSQRPGEPSPACPGSPASRGRVAESTVFPPSS